MPNKNGKEESFFWWASVLGSRPETVEVTYLNGEPVAYTCGCQDPFFYMREDSPIKLLHKIERPLRQKVTRIGHHEIHSHGWRGPR